MRLWCRIIFWWFLLISLFLINYENNDIWDKIYISSYLIMRSFKRKNHSPLPIRSKSAIVQKGIKLLFILCKEYALFNIVWHFYLSYSLKFLEDINSFIILFASYNYLSSINYNPLLISQIPFFIKILFCKSSGKTCSKFLKIECKNWPAWKKLGSGVLSVKITIPWRSIAPWAKGQCD